MWPFRRKPAELRRQRFEYKQVGGQALSLELLGAERGGKRRAVVCLFDPAAEASAPVPRFLAEGGFAVVTIAYRRASYKELAQQILDVADGLRWLAENADRLKIDCNGIGLWGYSRGGTLATLLGLESARKRCLEGVGGLGDAVRIDAIADTCSPSGLYVDLLFGNDEPCPEEAWAYWERQRALFANRSSLDRGALAESVALNPVNSISEMQCPYLLYHTTRESIWSLSDKTRYYRECRAQGIDVFYVIEDLAEGTAGWAAGSPLILDFFKQALGRRRRGRVSGGVAICRAGCEAKRFPDLLCPDEPGFGDYLTLDAWEDPVRWTPPGVDYGVFHSDRVGEDVSYLISLPPSYDADSNRRFPVVYWLYPTIQGPRSLAETVVPLTRASEKAGLSGESIVVIVNHCYFKAGKTPAIDDACINHMIALDLTAHIDAHFRTRPVAEARLLAGHSGSGPLALALALQFPIIFARVSLFAPAYLEALSEGLRTLSEEERDLLEVFLIYGKKDEIASLQEGFQRWKKELRLHKIKNTVKVVEDGRHSIESLFSGFATCEWSGSQKE